MRGRAAERRLDTFRDRTTGAQPIEHPVAAALAHASARSDDNSFGAAINAGPYPPRDRAATAPDDLSELMPRDRTAGQILVRRSQRRLQ